MSGLVWKGVGWLGVGIALGAIPISFVDPGMVGFALYASILLGGVASVGLNSSSRYAVVCIVLSLALSIVSAHYSRSSGFRPISLGAIGNGVGILLMPLLIAVGLVAWGRTRRRRN